MNGRKAFYLLTIASLVLVVGLHAPVAPSVADEPSPCIAVFLEHNCVTGFLWPLETELALTIDDPATPEEIDYQETQIVQADPDPNVPGSTSASYCPGEAFTIQPGHIVTLSGAGQTLTHTVTNLTLGGADMPSDRIWGTADPYSVVEVRHQSQRDIVRYETADAAGYWLADFGVPGDEPGEDLIHDFNEETCFMVMQSNGGGHTQIDWRMPSPWLEIQLTQNLVGAHGWPLDYPVTISIDDPSNGPGTDYSTTFDPELCPWGEGTCFGKELGEDFRVRAGHLVNLTNGFITQDYTVSSIQVTDVDSDADTVSGTAEPGATLRIEVKSNTHRHITADGAGSWTADFSMPGGGEDEQSTLDLIPWHEGTARVDDGSGSTAVTWPMELGIAVGDEIYAFNWYYGDEVTLTIDDPTTPAVPDYITSGFPGVGPWAYTGINFEIGGVFDAQPGHSVSLAQSDHSKICVVSPIAITAINHMTDRVAGVSNPHAHVMVAVLLGSGGEWARHRYVQADADGHWQVDFSQPGTHITQHPNEVEVVDIVPGMDVRASEGTEDACYTDVWGWSPPAVPVVIDIKPGGYPNSINLGSMGVVPVAVLTTEDFDASTVDPATVSCAGAAPLHWATEDVDYDGDLDLIFHFNTQELNLDENSTEATLTGETFDGVALQGTDTVNIVP